MGFLTAAAGTFSVGDTLYKLAVESGFAGLVVDGGWRNLVMIIIACVLLYLGIVKGFEPLLLVGIAFGCLLANISYFPGLSADLNATNALYHPELWDAFLDPASPYYHSYGHILTNAGLLDVFYIGVKAGDVLVVLEAMKMENEIMAPRDGSVAQVVVSKGAVVDTGAALVVLA